MSPNRVLTDSTGAVYVAGSTNHLASSSEHWFVRKSIHGDTNWALSDDYTPGPGTVAVANALAVDKDGAITLVGTPRVAMAEPTVSSDAARIRGKPGQPKIQ